MNSTTGRHILLPLLLSLFSAVGTVFILFAFCAGTDDILSLRETVILGAGFVLTAGTVFFLSRKLSAGTQMLTAVCAVLMAAACNFEFYELMKLPLQLPADNLITVTDIGDGASLSMVWAYRFRPRTQSGDPFTTNPDRDISFSQLVRNGDWTKQAVGEDTVLTTREAGSQIGATRKFRAGLTVLCFTAEGGTVTLKIPGRDKTVIVSPEITGGQPYRIIMRNGLIGETAGNLIQILLWGGGFLALVTCGAALCRAVMSYNGSHKEILILFCAFLIPCLFMTVLCLTLKICPFGEKSFLINDMWGEYADYMAYFRSILSGENDLFYSFSKSLGDDLLSLLAFYVINPLNWLICLFRPEDLPLAVTILVILRYGICGLTAAVYFIRRRNCGFSALLFSTCYALMSFHFVNAENTNLREAALILPLVIMGLEQLADGGPVRCYVWSLAAAVFLNFYSGYQICIFAALYFVIYFLLKQNGDSFIKVLLRFAAASLIAVGITAFLLVPVVIQLRNGPKNFDPSILRFSVNMPWRALFGKILASAYDVEQFKAAGLPNLYTGLACAALTALFFTNREINIRKKALSAVLLLISVLVMQVSPLNLALHGFNEPGWWPYRYSFIICFFVLTIAQESFAHRHGRTPAGLILTAGLFIVLAGLLTAANYGWMTGNSLKLNAAVFTAAILVLAFGFRMKGPAIPALLSVLTVFELFFNASHILSINTAFERSNTISDYVGYYTENKPVIDRIREKDDGFYRVEKTYSRTANDPMLLGYNGITHYSSTLIRNVMTFLPRTGFRYYPYRILYWEGSDTAMDSLLGIKYLVSGSRLTKPYAPVFTEGTHTVYENPYALPLMFTASPSVLNAEIGSEEEGFEIQNKIFSALIGEETVIFIPADAGDPKFSGVISGSYPGEICYAAGEDEDASLTWEITAKDSGTLYAFFPAEDIHPVRLTLNGKKSGYYYDEFSYHILRLGTFDPGETQELKMTLLEDRVCMRDAQFYHEDLSALERAVSILREDETELHKVTSSHLEGTFTASSDKLLFFTIPFDGGWTIRIDGRKIPAGKAFDTFMTVSAPQGSHTIEMRYLPVGLVPGVIISLLSMAAAVFIGRKEMPRIGSRKK